MKIDDIFKRQVKSTPVAKQGGCAPNSKAERPEGHTRASQSPAVFKDTVPNCDRDVQKAGGSGGPLAECTNKAGGSGGGTQSQPTKKQQDVQQIDLCDDEDSSSPADAPTGIAGEASASAQLQGQRHQQQGIQEQDQQQHADDAMDVDGVEDAGMMSSPAAADSSRPTSAQAAGGSALAAAVAEREPATPAGARLQASTAPAAATAPKSTGCGKGAAAETHLTPEQRKELLEACQQELPLLEAELDVRADLSSHLGCDKKPLELKQKVSLLAEGQALPLTELSDVISKTLCSSSSKNGSQGQPTDAGSPGVAAAAAGAADATQDAAAGEGGPSVLVVRNLIQEVASRKSYGLQDGALANVDALEDATADFHWCWELRTLTGLPKAAKQHADAARKHRKQVLERLKAATAYVQLAQSLSKPAKAAETKLARAAAKLSKTTTLEVLQGQLQAALEAAEQHCSTVKSKQAVSRLDKAAKEEQAAQAKAQKARQTEEEKAAKEAERAAKAAAKAAEAAEKARLKAEKEAEREAKRQQKADEAAKKAAETEKKAAETAKKKQATEAAKAGFGSSTELHKAQNVFKTFFGLAAQRPPTPSGGDTSQGQGSQMEGGSHKEQCKEAARLWVLASGPTQQQLCARDALEEQLPYFSSSSSSGADGAASHAAPRDLLAAAKQHWRVVRKQHKRVWGLPPSWAQRPGVAQDPDHVQRAAAGLYGEGVDITRLRCWRRKLIKHNDSVRPPFYGSVARPCSAAVTGRRPFGKHVELDYEEMSDQDWEEEPEGESLSADEEGDDEAPEEGADEDEEGFVVGDGYLSDDEGMRDDDDNQAGGLDCQLVGGAAAAAAGVTGAGGGGGDASSDSSTTAQHLAHLEAVLDHARSRGRHVVLVNNCPDMQWEPTTQLPASILSCLKGNLMRTDITAAPPTPADLPHIFGSSAAAAAAAAGSGSPAGAADGPGGPLGTAGTAAAGAGGGDAGGAAAGAAGAGAGGTAGGKGRPPSVFPEALLPSLVRLVHNSRLTLEQLVKQFVQDQSDAGVKVAKARVKDKIRDISSMRKVGKAPLYTVKPEVLQAVEQGTAVVAAAAGGGTPAAAAAQEGGAAADAGPTDMQVDGDDDAAAGAAAGNAADGQAHQQQPQQQEGAAGASTAGAKRPASADAVLQQQQQQSGPEPGQCASCPPAKKQKHTPAGGIERFFSAAKSAKQPQQQQQHEQQHKQQETPPSTPKHKLPGVPSLLHSELRDATAAGSTAATTTAAAAADGSGSGSGGSGGAGAGVERSGALPMLTPPSDAAAEDRPGKGCHSPVPFRLNSLGGTAAAQQDKEAAAAGAANGRGAAAAAPPAAEQQQQQQQQKKPAKGQDITALFKRRQQQQQQRQQQQQQQPDAGGGGRPGSGKGGLLGGSAAHGGESAAGAVTAAAAGGAHKPSRLGAGGGSSSISPPQLPEDGSPPSSTYWKQLAHWVVAVKEPSAADIEAAFEVFNEQQLGGAIHTMPQMMLSAMVKTLGSSSQSLSMRAACARCISNAVHCLVLREQQQLQQQPQQQQPQQQGPTSSPSPHQQQQHTTPGAAARTPTPPPSTAAAAGNGQTPSPVRRDLAAAAASPSPSGSPRSAPVGASYEELCAEPGLLSNLLLCMSPDKALEAARAARAAGSSSSSSSSSPLGPGATEGAEELARNAARAVSGLLLVGQELPRASGNNVNKLRECSSVTAAAAAQLRLRVASVGQWRGVLRAPLRNSEDAHRVVFVLMANWALLSDPVACSQCIANRRLASGLLQVVASRGSRGTSKWAVQKWCLLVLSALLSDSTFREWALPWGSALEPLQSGTDDTCDVLEAMAALLATALARPMPCLSDPDSADRAMLSHCLQLSSMLLDFLHAQQQQQQLPPRLAQLFDASVGDDVVGGAAGRGCSSLREGLQAVAEQTDWQEAALQAQQLLGGNTLDNGDPMRD